MPVWNDGGPWRPLTTLCVCVSRRRDRSDTTGRARMEVGEGGGGKEGADSLATQCRPPSLSLSLSLSRFLTDARAPSVAIRRSRWRPAVGPGPVHQPLTFRTNLSSATFAIIRASTIRVKLNIKMLIEKQPFGEKLQTMSACPPSSASTAGATCGTGTRGSASASRSKPTAANPEAEATGRWLLKCTLSKILSNTAASNSRLVGAAVAASSRKRRLMVQTRHEVPANNTSSLKEITITHRQMKQTGQFHQLSINKVPQQPNVTRWL